MLLADENIRFEMHQHGLGIESMVEGAIGPSSVDLMLSNHFRYYDDKTQVFHNSTGSAWTNHIDPQEDQSGDGFAIEVDDGDYFLLKPGDFALASTRERWTFPSHLAGRLEGKSSLGRLGLAVHVTAGFFDPGFVGYPTLELVNLRRRPMRLYPGMPIAQMSVFLMVSKAAMTYADRVDSKYTNQGEAPEGSQYHRNFPEEG